MIFCPPPPSPSSPYRYASVVFDTFDVDGSGAVDEEEFMVLCQTVNAAAPSFPGNFQRALEEFDT
jgi:hypothetical protein